ncbi:RNA exonuclease 4 isoform X2 [Myotis daubentonii]|uniref:RNA exonuclease 4 isoform X2 n=1 Tax=Myotis daubentonii TaxID=98922 RepID=UPI00287306BC|nr:RNA exonuclease 4 isoform X2 [Myotis daubentonii]
MVKAQGLAPARAPHHPVAEPALAKQLPRKKKKKKRFWKSKAREAGGRPGGDPSAALRPPRAPEAFSQNWKALQEAERRPGAPLLQHRCPARPAEQSTGREQPREGQMVTFLQNEGVSHIRSGKPERRRQPWPQPRPPREAFAVVQKEVAEMLRGRILVGHSLHNDLKVLLLDHPRKKVRDTQKYKPFKRQVQSGRPSLKLLAERILGVRVQQAEHCSIQDAQAAMRLYITVKKEWERAVQDRRPPRPLQTTAG